MKVLSSPMKKKLSIPFVFSILIHVIIIAVFTFLSDNALEKMKQEKRSRPIIAEIIPPEKLPQPKTKPVPPPPQLRPQSPVKELHPPKELSAERSSPPPGTKTTPGASASRSQQIETKDQGLQKVPLERPQIAPPAGKQAVPPPSLREKLFDRDVIGRLAQKKEGEEGTGNGITFDRTRIGYSGYMQRIMERVYGTWHQTSYPAEANEKGWRGEVVAILTVTKNGRFAAVELEKSSGYKVLDDDVLKALRDAQPYWPIPDEWKRDSVIFKLNFYFTDGRLSVR